MGKRTQWKGGHNKVMSIIDIIPTGSKNAVSRSYLLTLCKEHGIAKTDREMRRKIELARKVDVILNLSDGNGYFIPDKDDKDKLKVYLKQESDRYKSVIRNLSVARAMLEDLEKERI